MVFHSEMFCHSHSERKALWRWMAVARNTLLAHRCDASQPLWVLNGFVFRLFDFFRFFFIFFNFSVYFRIFKSCGWNSRHKTNKTNLKHFECFVVHVGKRMRSAQMTGICCCRHSRFCVKCALDWEGICSTCDFLWINSKSVPAAIIIASIWFPFTQRSIESAWILATH